MAAACAHFNKNGAILSDRQDQEHVPKRKVSDILFWTIAAVASVLFVGLLLALAGVIPVSDVTDPAPVDEEAAPVTATTADSPRRTEARSTTSTAERPAPAPASPRLTSVVITATRGESWFSARVGSENGRVLDERVLAQGESAQFEAEQVWLTVGAAGNVDVRVNGEPRPVEPGTIALVLTQEAQEGT
jgi:hypothetical protein